MIADWDLWPLRIAVGAGGDAVAMFVLERAARDVQRALGQAFYPVMRLLARDLRRVMAQ